MLHISILISIGLLVLLPGAEVSLNHQSSQQNQKDSPAKAPSVFKPDSLSPYLIELYIDINEDVDLRPIWQRLGVETAMPYKCDECMAESFEIDSTSEEGKAVALRISFGSGDYYQYLVFRNVKAASSKEEWIFIGNIDSRGARFAPPAHRIEKAEGRAWLVVRELWARRSSIRVYGDVWYEIKNRALKRVLEYPVEGRAEPCHKSLGHSYKSLLMRYGSQNGVYTIPVQFLISYHISDCEQGKTPLALFAKEQTAYYVWDSEKEQFVLDATQSDVTEKEIKSVYSIEESENEEFVKYNFESLLNLTKSGAVYQKDWLRQFLNNLQDSPSKKALQQSLQQ